MSLSPEIIDAMVASGCTAEQIGAVVKASMAEAEAKAEARRKGARERKRAQRERENGHASSHDVTVTERDTEDTPLDKEIPPRPPKEINPPLNPPVNPDGLTPPAEDLDGERVTKSEVVDGWNDLAARCGLPTIRKLTRERERKLASRIREHPLEDWQSAFTAIERSDFLRGKNDRGWRADFDFLLSPSKFVKLIEGQYEQAN